MKIFNYITGILTALVLIAVLASSINGTQTNELLSVAAFELVAFGTMFIWSLKKLNRKS